MGDVFCPFAASIQDMRTDHRRLHVLATEQLLDRVGRGRTSLPHPARTLLSRALGLNARIRDDPKPHGESVSAAVVAVNDNLSGVHVYLPSPHVPQLIGHTDNVVSATPGAPQICGTRVGRGFCRRCLMLAAPLETFLCCVCAPHVWNFGRLWQTAFLPPPLF